MSRPSPARWPWPALALENQRLMRENGVVTTRRTGLGTRALSCTEMSYG